jgi:uncharacterized membrane protein
MKDQQKRLPYSLQISRLGRLKLWITGAIDEAHTSLFFGPLLAVFLAIIGGVLLTRLDEYLTDRNENIPRVLATTVSSARIVLSTVAGATISFAGTAFSVSLLVIQLASSQYSPRITSTIFRDPFNKRVLAIVIGTFTYCLVVMRAVQEEGDENRALVPHISVGIASIMGIISILAIVGFIDHAAHSMDISDLLERVTLSAIQQIKTLWTEDDTAPPDDGEDEGQDFKVLEHVKTLQPGDDAEPDDKTPEDDDSAHDSDNEKSHSDIKKNNSAMDDPNPHVVRFESSGWVQEIDKLVLEWLVEENGCIKLHTAPGRYAIPGAPICSISPCPADEDDLAELDNNVRHAVSLGRSRTNRDDAAYGLRQLVDVSLRALSPGINDPTTAQDAIFHAAAVVMEFLRRSPPSSVCETSSGGILILEEGLTHNSIVLLAYDEVRRSAASAPAVCIYLLETLRQIRESLKAEGLEGRAPEIERQARLIEEGCLLTQQVPEDHQLIIQARIDRFPGSYAEAINKKQQSSLAKK